MTTRVGSAGYVVPAINEICAALLALKNIADDPKAIKRVTEHLEAASDKLVDWLKIEYGRSE